MSQQKHETVASPLAYNNDFICTISQQYFWDPVTTDCNHTFEKESISVWIEEQKQQNKGEGPKCPLCKHNFCEFTPNPEVKSKTDTFLLSNLSHLPFRYINQHLLVSYEKAFNEKNNATILQLIESTPHIIFQVVAGKKWSILSSLYSKIITDENFQKIFAVFKQIPGLEEFVLEWQDAHKRITLQYASQSNLTKFQYTWNSIKKPERINILTSEGRTLLHLTCPSKDVELFSFILSLTQNPKNLLLQISEDGRNVLMFACLLSTPEVVSLILKQFSEVTDKEILFNLLSNRRNPNIFENILQSYSFATALMLQEFIDCKFTPREKEALMNCMTAGAANIASTKLANEMKELQKTVFSLGKRLVDLEKKIISRPVMPFAMQIPRVHFHHPATETTASQNVDTLEQDTQAASQQNPTTQNPPNVANNVQIGFFGQQGQSGETDTEEYESHQIQCPTQ